MQKRAVEQLKKLTQFIPESTLLAGIVCVAWSVSVLGARAAVLPGRAMETSSAKQEAPKRSAQIGPSSPLTHSTPKAPSTTGTTTAAVSKVAQATAATATKVAASLLSEADLVRIEHAKELLGKFYKGSVVKAGEEFTRVDRFVRDRVAKAIKKPQFKKYSKLIADTVLAEASKHDFDPMFLMAVIENESSFNPQAVGPVGEIGLMQLTMPTGRWMAQKLRIKWEGKKTLRDPKINIRLGAAYLALLREQFDSQSQLYLAAYNMGSGNVRSALGRSIWPKDYARAVMRRYVRLYGYLKSEVGTKVATIAAQKPRT